MYSLVFHGRSIVSIPMHTFWISNAPEKHLIANVLLQGTLTQEDAILGSSFQRHTNTTQIQSINTGAFDNVRDDEGVDYCVLVWSCI